jgi:hypothetical protein
MAMEERDGGTDGEEPPEPEEEPATSCVPHPTVAAMSRREARR